MEKRQKRKLIDLTVALVHDLVQVPALLKTGFSETAPYRLRHSGNTQQHAPHVLYSSEVKMRKSVTNYCVLYNK